MMLGLHTWQIDLHKEKTIFLDGYATVSCDFTIIVMKDTKAFKGR